MTAKPKTVLVALNLKKPTDVLFRQLERIVSPGDRIELLIAYRHDVMPWFSAQVALIQTGSDRAVTWEERRMQTLFDEQKHRLERDVAVPARRVLSRIGVEVNVNLYSGSLNRVLNRYLKNGDATLFVGASPWVRWLKIAPARARNWFFRQSPNYASIA
jgi:hypothetical protein